ncbi:MAG TPA: hypothetical protein VF570_02295 [Pyrinomonadaceae bacterium]
MSGDETFSGKPRQLAAWTCRGNVAVSRLKAVSMRTRINCL